MDDLTEPCRICGDWRRPRNLNESGACKDADRCEAIAKKKKAERPGGPIRQAIAKLCADLMTAGFDLPLGIELSAKTFDALLDEWDPGHLWETTNRRQADIVLRHLDHRIIVLRGKEQRT